MSISLKRTLIVALLMVFFSIYLTFMSHGEPILPRKPFSEFPKTIGDWVGREEFFSQEITNVLRVDDYVLLSYRNSKGKKIHLYVGFYQNQREGQIIHSPKNCMPGAGWNITRTSLESLTIPAADPRQIKVLKLILEKGVEKKVVLYWYQSRGRFIASEYWQKIFLVYDAIFKNRTDGSFVRLIAPTVSGYEAEATQVLKDFAVNLIPILEDYIPGTSAS